MGHYLEEAGNQVEQHIFQGALHGFGLGEGTVAEGWIDNAIAFWKRNTKS